MKSYKNKIIVVLGPTASGKTGLGVELAQKFNGEIVSADSRQVYKGMDIGTGKDLKEYCLKIPNPKFQIPIPTAREKNQNSKIQKYKITKIPYHLIDVVSPKKEFNVAKYQKLAFKAIEDILQRGKSPIIVGGSGLYLQALVDGYELSEVKPDKELRVRLEKKSANQLFVLLEKINPKKAGSLNESDRKNKRRLIRYLEIAKQKGSACVAGSKRLSRLLEPLKKHDFLLIGISWPKDVLEKRIYKRLIERFEKENMIGEVERLHKQGVSWKRLESFGLEYKYISLYLQGKMNYEEMAEGLFIAIRQFAKKQMTWFRRWERQGMKINWIKNKKEALSVVNNFIK